MSTTKAKRPNVTKLDMMSADTPPHHKSAAAYLDLHPPGPEDSVYISPTHLSFVHNGESKQFRLLHLVSRDKQPIKVGGIMVTSDPELIATLDRYVAEYSGDVQRVK